MSPQSRSNEPSTSASLLELARGGDAEGWQRLAQIYGPIVYGWARRCGCQSADAADVMQDTFASVAGAIGRFDHQRKGATFRGWLWTIVRNKIRDQERNDREINAVGGTDAQIRMQQVCDQGPSQTLDGLLNDDEPPSECQSDSVTLQRRTLELLRESFDPRTWKMFWETSVIGRSPTDVAAEMEVSRWAVYKARARVLQRLQREMDGLE